MTDERYAASPGYRPGDAAYRRIMLALFLAGVGTFAMTYCTQAVLPLLSEEFDLSAGTSTLAVSATTGALGTALLFLGPLSEALGRVWIMRASLVAAAVATLASALAPSWFSLIAVRAVAGLLVAGLPAVAVAYLREEVAPEALGRVTARYIGGTAIGGMTGRFVSGGVADLWGWRWGIAAIAGVGALCAVGAIALLPRSRHFSPVPLRPAALAEMTRRMVTDRALLSLYGIGFGTMGAFVGVYNAAGFRLTRTHGLSLAVASLVFGAYALGSVASGAAGRAADRWGVRAVVPMALVVAVAGLALTLAPQLPALVVGLCVLTVGFFACHAVVSSWVAARAAATGPGASQAGSLYLFAYYLGSSVAGTTVAAMWAHGWGAVTALAGTLLLGALLLSLVLRRIPSLLEPPAPDPGVTGM
ncbi:MAG: MFS transporter [Micrococcales bacterium]|nr:MFS transporter [Micrococcales bacterium]